MDYNNQQNKNPDFFTIGTGTNDSEINNFESGNNLDLSNTQTNWQNVPSNNTRNIGNKVAGISKEQNQPIMNQPMINPNQGNRAEPQTVTMPAQAPDDIMPHNHYRREVIKVDNSLNKEGIAEIEKIEEKLSRDGNAADFYEIARDMMEANLDNSYNRKLAA